MSLLNDSGILDELPDFMNFEGADLPNEEHENLFGEVDNDNDEKLADGNKIVSAKKRTVRNPRPRLTAELLSGERGIQNIEDYFKDIQFKGKGKEAEDLDAVMRRLQHWAHRLYPAYKFDDALTAIERLSNKRPLQVHMSRYRLGLLEKQVVAEEEDVGNNVDDEEDNNHPMPDEPYDEFDALLDQQISISRLETKTPNQKTLHNKYMTPSNKSFASPSRHVGNHVSASGAHMSTVTPTQSTKPSLSAEQKAKMEENRRLAMERLKAKKKNVQQVESDDI